MADLYSILPGIQVSADEILEAELISTQILQAQFPDMDLREGTAVKDLVIRPNATLLALINKALNYYFVQNTIAGVNNDTPEEMVDSIMSNWFLTRVVGTRAVINARLYFARQKDVSLASDVFFSTDNSLRFYPQVSSSISAASLVFDSFNNEYYFDVDLVAESAGQTYNISSGSLLYFSNFDPYFLHAEINFLKQTATNTETNEQFIARAETAISTRNLINVPSIQSKIIADFPLVERVTPVGMGDPDMIRDQIEAYVPTLTPPHTLVHSGGMTDVYCKTPLSQGVVQLTTDASGIAHLGGAVYSFSRSEVSGSDADDTVPFYVSKSIASITRSSTTATVTTAGSHGYSNGQTITILGASPAGYNGAHVITVTGASTFTYAVANTLTTPATGTMTANVPTPYTSYNFYRKSDTVTITSSGTTATVSLDAHGYSPGRYVVIAGANQSAYNGVFKVVSADHNTFTYTMASSPGVSPATGTISCTGTEPTEDYGFSDKQIIAIDFGGTYANSTASFNINFFSALDGLQTYVEDSSHRVLSGDLLARGYNTYVLDVDITSYNATAADSSACAEVVKTYLSSLEPGQIFVISNLQARLHAAGIESFKTPIDITYTFYHRDLIPPLTGTITDVLDPNDGTSVFVLGSLTTQSENV